MRAALQIHVLPSSVPCIREAAGVLSVGVQGLTACVHAWPCRDSFLGHLHVLALCLSHTGCVLPGCFLFPLLFGIMKRKLVEPEMSKEARGNLAKVGMQLCWWACPFVCMLQVKFMKWAATSEVQWDKPVHIPDGAKHATQWHGTHSPKEFREATQATLRRIIDFAVALRRAGADADWWSGVDPKACCGFVISLH